MQGRADVGSLEDAAVNCLKVAYGDGRRIVGRGSVAGSDHGDTDDELDSRDDVEGSSEVSDLTQYISIV